MEIEDPEFTEPSQYPDLSRVRDVARRIREGDKAWDKSPATLSFGTVSWTPDLTRKHPKACLHVHLGDRLMPYVLKRMRAARDAGWRIEVAIPLSALYSESVLLELLPLEPSVHVIDHGSRLRSPSSLLTAVADHEVRLTAQARVVAAAEGFRLVKLAGSKHLKGRRLESLIAFLLSQVSDFTVLSINYRTRTEELDVVVKVRSTTGRSWALGVPFLLVEAKNWRDPVDQQVVSAFLLKVMGKRGTVRIGLIFGMGGFTTDAAEQELRFASQGMTIALLGPADVQKLVEAHDIDQVLDDMISQAMLR